MTTAIVPSDLDLVAQHYPSSDRNPAAVYLASLTSERSRRTMRHALRAVVATVQNRAVDDVTDQAAMLFPWHELRYQHTAAIRAKLQETYSYSSVNRILSALRRVLKECWRLGYVDNETMARACDIGNVKGETVPAGRDLSQGEILALVNACRTDDNEAGGIRDAAILGVLYTCGMRRAELAGLDLADLNIETGAIRIRHGKGNKQRVVYATNGTLAALRDWLSLRGDEPGALFLPVRRGGHLVKEQDHTGKLGGLTAQTIYDMLKRRAEQAEGTDFSPHDFRRTFVGDLLDRGVDISTVQKLAGHASVSTTARYDRRPEGAKLEAAQKLHFPYNRRRLLDN